jgi:hypothetical protein
MTLFNDAIIYAIIHINNINIIYINGHYLH